MTTEIVTVPFHGDDLIAVRDGEGIWVPVRRVCDVLGIDIEGQRKKLKNTPWARTAVMNSAVAEDGKVREMYCIHLDALPMWLATIEPSRVGEDVRPKLVRYQCEAAKVLRDHFVATDTKSAWEIRRDVFLLEQKAEHSTTWSGRIIGSICKLYGHKYDGGRHPRFLASVIDYIYRTINGDDLMDVVKDRNPTPHHGSNHHQWFREHDMLVRDLEIVYALAETARSVDDFKQRLHWHYRRRPMQLGF